MTPFVASYGSHKLCLSGCTYHEFIEKPLFTVNNCMLSLCQRWPHILSDLGLVGSFLEG